MPGDRGDGFAIVQTGPAVYALCAAEVPAARAVVLTADCIAYAYYTERYVVCGVGV